MKTLILFILASVIFISCRPYTEVKIVREMNEIPSEEPVYIFNEEEFDYSDSAEFVGMISIAPQLARFSIFNNSDASNIHNKAKNYGANCLVVLDPPFDNKKHDFEGKLYFKKTNFENIDINKDRLIQKWSVSKPDQYEGIYEKEFGYLNKDYKKDKVQFAIVKDNETSYKMIYLSGYETLPRFYYLNDLSLLWKSGDVKAYIKKTDVANIFTSTYFDIGKVVSYKERVKIANGYLQFNFGDGTVVYNKTYPEQVKEKKIKGTLTGFAVDKNTILTCYHGFRNIEKEIYIKGINGDFEKEYKASLVNYDKENDLALLKLEDSNSIKNYTPFSFANKELDIADKVFVLGYPMSDIMGEEIKLTDGIISAKSGHAEDPTSYQISAPIQPGNSGSPLFDNNANVVGMVFAQISGSDNVGYALKLKYINEFFTKNGISINNQSENALKDLTYIEKVKKLEKSIFLIEILDIPFKINETIESVSNEENSTPKAQRKVGR